MRKTTSNPSSTTQNIYITKDNSYLKLRHAPIQNKGILSDLHTNTPSRPLDLHRNSSIKFGEQSSETS
ncbi:hypothetical protein J6590_079983 [Homalodisca vitripennis]|nr:hypothetical protein J6590_079983 [Homalodisca vitripennis]